MIWSYPPTRKQLAATIGLFLTGASLSVYGAYMSLANIAPQQARAKARVEIFCAPTADAGEIWKASMTHIALEGGCFVLSSNQFCRRRDYPFPPGDSNGDAALADAITCAGGQDLSAETNSNAFDTVTKSRLSMDSLA
ncbi:hypothetical protein DKX38_010278 [Salix brachista]|uniref:Uncharacterized protein n=1 Tax=Salix brachista TaxID=2182728 RepID=A0A5N5MD40_9ROSI|nr:hypothetical protein DKX38_010278 [Salix brachista]